MKAITLLFLTCLVAVCMARPADYDYEEKKPNPLLRRSPLNRAGTKTSTTTTTPAPLEDEEIPEDGDYDDEVESQQTTTTEAPKKKIGPGMVRPFRSNDDLLAALKRRREQASNGKSHSAKVHEPVEESVRDEVTPAPKRATTAGRRNRFNSPAKNTAAQEEEEPAAVAASTPRAGRRFNTRA